MNLMLNFNDIFDFRRGHFYYFSGLYKIVHLLTTACQKNNR